LFIRFLEFDKQFPPFLLAYFWPAAALRAGGGGPEDCVEKWKEILSIL
jgi:hypothetical protein